MEYASAVAIETAAATDSGLANLAVGASATVSMVSACGKAAKPAGKVDDTSPDTSAVGAKGQVSFLQRLVAATAAALAALTAANVMEGMAGVRAAFPPCSSCLLIARATAPRGQG